MFKLKPLLKGFLNNLWVNCNKQGSVQCVFIMDEIFMASFELIYWFHKFFRGENF